MLLTIEKFINAEETARLLGLAETGVFVDGRGTAGAKLRDVKKNEQLKTSEQDARTIHQVLSPAMERSTAPGLRKSVSGSELERSTLIILTESNAESRPCPVTSTRYNAISLSVTR